MFWHPQPVFFSNAPKIEAIFKSVIQSNISASTIRQFIKYLEDAFVIHKEIAIV